MIISASITFDYVLCTRVKVMYVTFNAIPTVKSCLLIVDSNS